jgi:hypothetical protein
MAKKTRKSRRTRRRTRRQRRRGGSAYPLIPPTEAIQVSTAGDNSDNLMGM